MKVIKIDQSISRWCGGGESRKGKRASEVIEINRSISGGLVGRRRMAKSIETLPRVGGEEG